MTDDQKTLAAAAVLAAAVGVYMEISHQQKLALEARRRVAAPAPSALAAPSASASTAAPR